MNVMKAIYLSAALLFFTVSAIAQTNILDITFLPGLEKNSFIKRNKQPIIKGFSLPKYGIIKLPQDNMPCLVPDASSIAAMPTVKTVLPYQSIPNPYFKYNTLPLSTAKNINSLPR
jgi:hypothetical protein